MYYIGLGLLSTFYSGYFMSDRVSFLRLAHVWLKQSNTNKEGKTSPAAWLPKERTSTPSDGHREEPITLLELLTLLSGHPNTNLQYSIGISS